MANKDYRKPQKGRTRRRGEAAKIVTLLVLIGVGLTIVGGSIWYYGFFQPAAAGVIETTAAGFAQEYYTADYRSISGQEAAGYMTDSFAAKTQASGRVDSWQEQELAIKVVGDVETSISKQGLNSALARVIFLQQEQTAEEKQEYLVYYDLELVREGKDWRVNQIRVPDPEELKTLREHRGLLTEEPSA